MSMKIAGRHFFLIKVRGGGCPPPLPGEPAPLRRRRVRPPSFSLHVLVKITLPPLPVAERDVVSLLRLTDQYAADLGISVRTGVLGLFQGSGQNSGVRWDDLGSALRVTEFLEGLELGPA